MTSTDAGARWTPAHTGQVMLECAIETVRVLVYGGVGEGACDYYRLGMYTGYLAQLGIEILPWSPQFQYPSGYGQRWFDAVRDGKASVDLSALPGANVVLFSRWFNTSPSCSECGRECGTPDKLARHARTSGHLSLAVDPILRPLVGSMLADQAWRDQCGILYDLDDDLFHQPDWVGHRAGLARELDLVELLIRSSDLTTVSTPPLARTLGPFTPRAIVVRNAVELGLYSPPAGDSVALEEEVRILFYGAPVRIRDYEICRPAVDQAAATSPQVKRIWLGATGRPIARLVDETYPYTASGAPFAARLAATRPNIGLAPLGQGEFAAAKSELHWLEYSAVGAATVATRLRPNGPYDVIRDGIDGLLAESPEEWRQHLARLVGQHGLSTELAGRARERVAAEYSAAKRAVEWAAVFRWVASHPGIGRTQV